MTKFFQKRGRWLKQILIVIISAYLIVSPLTMCAIAAEKKEQANARSVRQERPDNTMLQIGRDQSQMEQYYLPRALEGAIDPDSYVLGPADEMVLIFQGAEERLITLKVLPEGAVILPNVGQFEAAGLTLSEFKRNIVAVLARYYKNLSIDCQLSIPRTFLVYVLGEVEYPGAVQLFAPFRLSRALEQAGGVLERGSMRAIEIREGERLIRTADMFSFLSMGISDENVILTEGQTIYVPPRRDVVTSIGELRKPARYEILPGETVADLIAFSGGITSLGDTTRIIVEQFDEGRLIATREVPLLECAGVILRDQDVVVVPDMMSYTARPFVQVVGGGGRGGLFYISEGERLKDFLVRIGRFREKFDLRRGVLERRMPGAETEFVYLNLQEILDGGSAGSIVLQGQDIITIPEVEQNVFVVGEVTKPGEVQFLPGMTAERYISLAGGPNESGGLGRLEIFALDGSQRSGDQNSLVYRGETIIVKRKTSKVLGSMLLGMATITGLLLSIIAITK